MRGDVLISLGFDGTGLQYLPRNAMPRTLRGDNGARSLHWARFRCGRQAPISSHVISSLLHVGHFIVIKDDLHSTIGTRTNHAAVLGDSVVASPWSRTARAFARSGSGMRASGCRARASSICGGAMASSAVSRWAMRGGTAGGWPVGCRSACGCPMRSPSGVSSRSSRRRSRSGSRRRWLGGCWRGLC